MLNWKNWKGYSINPKTICDLLQDFEQALSRRDDAALGGTGVRAIDGILKLAIDNIYDFKPIEFSRSINKLGHISERTDRLGARLKNHQEFKRAWLDAAFNKLDGFSPQGLSNSIWGLAKLGYRDLEFENEWIRIAIDKLKDFNTQNLANSIWALDKLKHSNLEFENEWIRIAIYKLQGFKPQELANSISALASLGHYNKAFVNRWVEIATKKLEYFNTQNLANSIEALADLDHYDKYFIKEWIKVAINKLHRFKSQELASGIRALANLNHYDEYFINKWILITTEELDGFDHKATKLDEFNSQELASSIRALANLEHHDKGFINSWIAIAINKLNKFKPQELANSLSALAKLGHYNKAFVDKWIGSIPSNKLEDFNTQNLANSIWALAKLKHYNGDFIEAWIAVAAKKLEDFNPQELANSLSALANFGHYNKAFVEEWISFIIATKKLYKFNSQDLANSIWALAKLGHYNKAFVDKWIDSIPTKKLKGFNPQELANSIWALAKLKHHHEGFVNEWIGIATKKLYKFNSQDLANSVWALAKLNHYDEYFINEWIGPATRELEEFSIQGLSNIIWALAKLEHSDQSFEKAWIASTTKQLKFDLPEEQFNPQNLANSIWALAKLEHRDEGFAKAWIAIVTKKFKKLEKCERQDLDSMKKFSPQDLANSIWALATLNLNFRDKSFEKEWIAIAIKKLKEFNLQNLANSVWALAKLGIDDRRLVDSLFSQLKGRVEYFNAYEGKINSIYDLENARHKWHDAQKLSSEAGQQLGVEEQNHGVSASSAMETADNNKRLRANGAPMETSLQKRQKFSYRDAVFSSSNRMDDGYECKDDQALDEYRGPVYGRTSAGEAGEISLVTVAREQSQEKQNAGFGRKKDEQPPKPAGKAKEVMGYYSNDDVIILLDGLLRRNGFERINGGNEQDIVRNLQSGANTRTMVLAPIAEDSEEAVMRLHQDISRAYNHNIEQVLVPINIPNIHWYTIQLTLLPASLEATIHDSLGVRKSSVVVEKLMAQGINAKQSEGNLPKIQRGERGAKNGYCGGYTARLIANLVVDNRIAGEAAWGCQNDKDDILRQEDVGIVNSHNPANAGNFGTGFVAARDIMDAAQYMSLLRDFIAREKKVKFLQELKVVYETIPIEIKARITSLDVPEDSAGLFALVRELQVSLPSVVKVLFQVNANDEIEKDAQGWLKLDTNIGVEHIREIVLAFQKTCVMFEAQYNANNPEGRLEPIVMRVDKIVYENHLLNEAGAIELLNHATRYDASVMNLLFELGTDREATDALLEAVEESGARTVLDILSRKNEEAAPSGTQLTLVTVSAGPMPERTAPHSSNFFVNLINELTLRYKIMLYGSELRRFDEIITAYNIEIPKEHTKLDLLRNDRLFSKNVMLKVHPDKNPFGSEACHEDTIFVRELKSKLAQKLDIRRSLEDNVLTIQSVLYKANLGFKAVDACIDLARVVYEPTLPNIRKAALDYTYLYATYSGFNRLSAFIGGADTLYQLSLGNYQEAFSTASSTMGYMLLPYMLALAPIPHAGFIYALWMTGYSAYYSFANAYAFYIEQSSEEAAFRSIAAYKELTGLIFNSPLQSLYDFAETAKGYEMQLTKAVLLKEHGEFGQKLYDYLYAPSLKEKYDLLSQISKNLISEEAAEALKAKHIVITDGHKSYDLCREIKATAIVDSEQYYCFNIEEQVLDHVMISGSGNLGVIEHL